MTTTQLRHNGEAVGAGGIAFAAVQMIPEGVLSTDQESGAAVILTVVFGAIFKLLRSKGWL